MSDDTAPPSGREVGRALFVCGTALALILAAALLPTITASFGQTPVESLLSGQQAGFGGELGALNPGQETTVGGLEAGESQALRSQSAAVHFVVQSTEPSYWRTGAYDTYTGSGWRRTDRSRPASDPLAVDGMVNRTVSYEVQLNRSASALPTVWRPQQIETDAGFQVTSQRALRTDRPLSPGTTYRATSVIPPRDPAILSTAGQEYPAHIAGRYTQLPGTSAAQLGSFTSQLTADAENPYETAAQIEQWLETNKSYSLNVSQPAGDSVASDFVFDMEAGYCEYFATSMVAMLRSQDIPARYVVGYSTGQQTGTDTYTVRGVNAHAWVEVYFPDVGWVRFDPTPGQERLSAEREAIEQQTSDADGYNPTEQGSPGESFSPNDSDSTAPSELPDGIPDIPQTPDDPSVEQPNGADSGVYDVRLSERPVPGRNVTVNVDRDGEPVEDALVLFNGEVLGRTDWAGRVTGTIPYADRLNVTVSGPAQQQDSESGASASRTGTLLGSGDASQTGTLFAVEPGALQTTGLAIGPNDTTENRTYDLPTDARLSISGPIATGQQVLLTVTVAGRPVPSATVERDGRVVGTTDASGRIEMSLPDDPGTVQITAHRGSVSGNRTIRIEALRLDADPQAPIALPGTEVTVTARLGNETVAGVPVSVDGERIGTTGIDGTLRTSLPLADRATISVAINGQQASATVDGLWLNVGVLVGTAGALLVGAAVVLRRRGLTTEGRLDRLLAVVRSLPQRLLGGLLVAADGLVRVGTRVLTVLTALLAGARSVLAGEVTPRELLAASRSWIRARALQVRALVAGGTVVEDDSISAETESPSYLTIREAWAEFLDTVSVSDPETKTPGELATHAIEYDGLPAEPVRRLRDAFRAVEYGDRSPADRLRAVETAVEQLRQREETMEESG